MAQTYVFSHGTEAQAIAGLRALLVSLENGEARFTEEPSSITVNPLHRDRFTGVGVVNEYTGQTVYNLNLSITQGVRK